MKTYIVEITTYYDGNRLGMFKITTNKPHHEIELYIKDHLTEFDLNEFEWNFANGDYIFSIIIEQNLKSYTI